MIFSSLPLPRRRVRPRDWWAYFGSFGDDAFEDEDEDEDDDDTGVSATRGDDVERLPAVRPARCRRHTPALAPITPPAR